jgi:hypothetical protein
VRKAFDKKPLIVAAGSPDDVRSSIWRLWIQGDDIYFGTRDTLPAFKISLHQSGIWRAAFVKKLEGADSDKDRAVKKWPRPAEFNTGMTNAVAVVISSIPPRRAFEAHRVKDPRIKWIPPASRNCVTILFVSIASKGTDTDPIRFARDRLLGRLRKSNGEIVCLIANERPLTNELGEVIQEVMKNLKINVDQVAIDQQSIKRCRAILLKSDDVIGANNAPTLFDVEIGWDNVVANK